MSVSHLTSAYITSLVVLISSDIWDISRLASFFKSEITLQVISLEPVITCGDLCFFCFPPGSATDMIKSWRQGIELDSLCDYKAGI